ncbi:hypothetical protein BHE74_00018121 [Ensete ventricosum]|nr:hypothetical protein BHE74_00018121 [Ensete ventricosum]
MDPLWWVLARSHKREDGPTMMGFGSTTKWEEGSNEVGFGSIAYAGGGTHYDGFWLDHVSRRDPLWLVLARPHKQEDGPTIIPRPTLSAGEDILVGPPKAQVHYEKHSGTRGPFSVRGGHGELLLPSGGRLETLDVS